MAVATARHPTLWFDDGQVVLQADDTIFRVERSYLCRESAFFDDLFSLKQPPLSKGEAHDGTESRPLFVPDVSARALGNILKMLYTVSWGQKLTFEIDELEEMLRAAHRLQFASVLSVVADQLAPRLRAERRLHFGLARCGVDEWAFPAFVELVYDYQAGPTCASDVGLQIWNGVFDARVRVIALRTGQATQCVEAHMCSEHLGAYWRAAAASGSASALRTKTAKIRDARRACGVKICRLYADEAGAFTETELNKLLNAEANVLLHAWDAAALGALHR